MPSYARFENKWLHLTASDINMGVYCIIKIIQNWPQLDLCDFKKGQGHVCHVQWKDHVSF